jgi:hypothetical protein
VQTTIIHVPKRVPTIFMNKEGDLKHIWS